MAKIELKWVQAFRDRHGKLRHYFRRPGFPRVPLPGDAGSVEFMEAYQGALQNLRTPIGIAGTQPCSIHALIASYYQTLEFRKLETSTQRTYRNMLDRFREAHGTKGARTVQARHLDAIFTQMSETPGAARNLRKRLRRVFRHAVKLGWRRDNPVLETDTPGSPGVGFEPWTETEIRQFENYWPSGTRERLAFALLLYTGQRRSDVVRMGRQHLEGNRLTVRQQKTKKTNAPISIPLHPALAVELAHSATGMTFLLTQLGAPFTTAGFTNWFKVRAELAGIRNRTPHGLRKAAGRRLAEAGCSAREIASVLGHRSLAEVERYTRDADQWTLASQAFARLPAKG